MKYIVIELQSDNDIVSVLNPATYDTYEKACQDYYYRLSCASVSEVENHSVTILNEYGLLVENKTFIHPKAPKTIAEEPPIESIVEPTDIDEQSEEVGEYNDDN